MMRRVVAFLMVAGISLSMGACSDSAKQDPAAPPAMVVPAPLVLSLVTSTTWDFVALAGANGRLGNPRTFTIAGAGSIVGSVTQEDPGPTELNAKGFNEPVGSEERGLGLCRVLDPTGACGSPGDEEIGDVWPDGANPSIYLDFTGLVSGSVVTGVTIASVQETEGYSISWSSDGVNYSLLAAGVGAAGSPVISFPVPSGTNFLRFDVGAGGAGNNYIVQSVTVNSPPQGKTFTIGPSSMEGAILIKNGDWVNGGYSFKFVNGSHPATNFSVHATVSLTGPCVGGGPATDTFTFPLNDATYAVPTNNTNWLPTGDANSVLSWEGSVIAAGVCGGIGKLNASKGAVFTATVSQNPPSGSLVDFRFKYRDPAAKGKPNTNCLDTSDPNRARADVCGASWSQTVRDP